MKKLIFASTSVAVMCSATMMTAIAVMSTTAMMTAIAVMSTTPMMPAVAVMSSATMMTAIAVMSTTPMMTAIASTAAPVVSTIASESALPEMTIMAMIVIAKTSIVKTSIISAEPSAVTIVVAMTSEPVTVLGYVGAAVAPTIPTTSSRLLPFRANRLANIIAGAIETLAVISMQFVYPLASGAWHEHMFASYIFFGTIETVCTSVILWKAWTWSGVETVRTS